MFRTVPLSIIRSFSLYTQQWYMSYKFSQVISKPVWYIPLLYVEWKTPDDVQRNCLKHVEFYSKNKFQKLVHLVGFIIRIYHDARSPERQSGWGITPLCFVYPRMAQISSTILLVVVQTTTPFSLPPPLLPSLSCSSLSHLSILLLDSTYIQS